MIDWGDKARDDIKKLPFDDGHFRAETGSPELFGEKGFSTLERLWMRPTCEVNGLLSGYTGEGAKTVLPAKAMAKVSCRLVPNQTPEEIERLMRAHVERVTPKGVTATVTPLHGGRPWRADIGGPLFDAARRALAAAFEREPVITGRRRLDSRRRRLSENSQRAGAARRVRAAGRERACAERVDERGELLQGHGGDGRALGRAREALALEASCCPKWGPVAALERPPHFAMRRALRLAAVEGELYSSPPRPGRGSAVGGKMLFRRM